VSSGVNFINVLRAHFSYEILAPKITKPNVTREKLMKSCQKDLLTKKAPIKCWWNWHLGSISPMFFARVFRKTQLEKRRTYEKRTRKMRAKTLVKSTPGDYKRKLSLFLDPSLSLSHTHTNITHFLSPSHTLKHTQFCRSWLSKTILSSLSWFKVFCLSSVFERVFEKKIFFSKKEKEKITKL